MKNFSLKILGLAILGMALFSSQPAEARRVRGTDSLRASLYQAVSGIGYQQEETEEIISLIEEIFPDLEELRGLSIEERISVLAQMVKQKIDGYAWQKEEYLYFDLPEVLRDKKAICLIDRVSDHFSINKQGVAE